MDPSKAPDVEIVDDDRLLAREALSDRFGDLWWTFLLRGLLAAGVGVAALFWPSGSISLLLQLVGLLLVIDGGLTFLGFGRRGTAAGVGIAAVLIGVVLLVWPEGTARFAFALLGAFALMSGAGSLLTWRRMPEWHPERTTARNAGLVAVLIGVLLFFWPGSGLVAFGWAIAFAALTVAGMMVWLAFRFKGAKDRVKIKAINPR